MTSEVYLRPQDIIQFKSKYGFTEENIQQFQEAFSVFDRDCDGVITTDELGTVMVALGHRPSLQELEALIRGVDKTKIADSGSVSFDAFLQLMANRINIDPEAELREVFSVFDVNRDGLITSDELFGVLTRLGESINKVPQTLLNP